jgi:two-component system CheB/CheR fusion protein
MSLNASRVIQNTHREQLILLVIADITEVRHLKEAKERIEKELRNKEKRERKAEKVWLEKAVAERTRELKEANQSLEDKNTTLLNVNKELEAFTYVSSHDLQEPLRKLQTFAGMILEKENQNLSAKGKNYFRLMQESAERMRQLIQDLLSFSRISAAERKFENIDLNIILEEVKHEFEAEIAKKHAVIEVTEICNVHIIPFQFRQLMHTLISNALKFYNPKGLPPEKEYCFISIADNGIGFENEFSTRIFEVFQKLHGKDEYSGTGIGLAIVKKIVDNHKGIITATGELNKGATFNIYIPILH